MELFVEKLKGVFNTDIKKGTLIWARSERWGKGIPGFISAVSEDRLTVMFHPDISNVVNHYVIPAGEVAEGKWEIRWSEDLETINQFVTDEGGDHETGGTDQETTSGESGADEATG